MVYHFVSKTSRSSEDYALDELESNLQFVRKWGYRYSKYNKVYKKAYKLDGPAFPDLVKALDLMFKSTPEEANIVVEIDSRTFVPDDYTSLTQLNDIVFEGNELGKFELGNMKVNVKSLESFEKDLIFIRK
jgi:hypothetical protein